MHYLIELITNKNGVRRVIHKKINEHAWLRKRN
jgi:hypothetical protein